MILHIIQFLPYCSCTAVLVCGMTGPSRFDDGLRVSGSVEAWYSSTEGASTPRSPRHDFGHLATIAHHRLSLLSATALRASALSSHLQEYDISFFSEEKRWSRLLFFHRPPSTSSNFFSNLQARYSLLAHATLPQQVTKVHRGVSLARSARPGPVKQVLG